MSYLTLLTILSLLFLLFAFFSAMRSQCKIFKWAVVGAFVLYSMVIVLFLCRIMSDDFSFQYIAKYSQNSLPFYLKFASLWAGQAGSLLFWNYLTLLLLVIQLRENDSRFLFLLLSIIFLMCINILFSNPFYQAEGNVVYGMNSVLRNGWMVIHPPLLFAGYSLAQFLFNKTAYSIIGGTVLFSSSEYRKLIIATFVMMSAGIASGGIWSYGTLGWGGFWGWDPVENGSLIPWLLLVILLHVKQDNPGLRASLLRVVSLGVWLSALFAVFVTRSGLLADVSVHSFEKSSLLLPYAVLFFTFLVLSAFLIFKGRALESSVKRIEKNIFLIALILYTLSIVFFTYLPVVATSLLGFTFSVNPSLYNVLTVPLVLVSLFYIVSACIKRRKTMFIFAIMIFLIVMVLSFIFVSTKITFCLLLSAAITSLIVILISFEKKLLLKFCAHIGYIIFIIGVVFAFALPQKETFHLERGNEIDFKGNKIQFKSYTKDLLWLDVNNSDYLVQYQEQGFAEPLIVHGLLADLYLAPYRYLSSSEIAGSVWLYKDRWSKSGSISLRLVHIDHVDGAMIARIEYTDGDQSGLIKLAQLDIGEPVTIYPSGRGVEYRYFEKNEKKLLVWLEPSDAAAVPDVMIFEGTMKWGVNLVWLGIVLFILTLAIMFVRGRDGKLFKA